MTYFTKIGVWDKEIKEFITSLNDETKIPKDALTKWFYSEGAMAFVLSQTHFANQYEESYKAQHKFLPETITADLMFGFKKAGFMALRPAMMKKFAKDNVLLGSYLENHFDYFVDATVKKHQDFYAIQAEVKNALNHFLNIDPKISMAVKTKFIVEQFEKYKKTKPAFIDKINDDILFIKEFIMAMQQQVST